MAMKLTVRWIVLSCILFRVATVHADDFRIVCPATFAAQAVIFAPVAIPAGWTPFMPGFLYVGNAAIIYGPPATRKYSVPTSTTDGRKVDTTTWELAEGEKWLSCGYGAGDELTLSAPLPRDATKCTARLQKDERGTVTDVSLQCTRDAGSRKKTPQ